MSNEKSPKPVHQMIEAGVQVLGAGVLTAANVNGLMQYPDVVSTLGIVASTGAAALAINNFLIAVEDSLRQPPKE